MKESRIDMASGAFAGGMVRLVTAPLDVLKIRFQLQHDSKKKYSSILQGFKRIIHEEGALSLWKGNLSATYLWVSYTMLQFWSYGLLRRWGNTNIETIQDYTKLSNSNSKAMVTFFSGTIAGVISITATYPFDLMRTHFVVQGNESLGRVADKTMLSFLKNTVANSGFLGLFAGLPASVTGVAIQAGFNFSIYDQLKQYEKSLNKKLVIEQQNTSKKVVPGFDFSRLWNATVTAVCGGIAGGTSKCIVFPFDTVKKRLQVEVLTSTFHAPLTTQIQELKPRNTVLSCMRNIFKDSGISGFYKGFSPAMVKAMLTGAVTFSSFELAKTLLQPFSEK